MITRAFITGGSFLLTMKNSLSFKRQGMASDDRHEATYFE